MYNIILILALLLTKFIKFLYDLRILIYEDNKIIILQFLYL